MILALQVLVSAPTFAAEPPDETTWGVPVHAPARAPSWVPAEPGQETTWRATRLDEQGRILVRRRPSMAVRALAWTGAGILTFTVAANAVASVADGM